jgi:hypothetical protein
MCVCGFQAINSWLPLAEHKLAGMRPPASDPNTLRDQMEEIKVRNNSVNVLGFAPRSII